MWSKKLIWVLMFVVLCSSAFAALTDDNVLYNSFDDISTIDYDMYGATDADGKIDRGLSFDGTNDYVSFESDLSSTLNNAHSFSLWFNSSSSTGNLQLLGGFFDSVTDDRERIHIEILVHLVELVIIKRIVRVLMTSCVNSTVIILLVILNLSLLRTI